MADKGTRPSNLRPRAVRRPTRTHLAAVTALLACSSAAAAGIATTISAGPAAAATSVNASVDLTAPLQTTTPEALGVGSSTYSASPQNSTDQAAAEQKLDARFVRLPVGVRNGRVTSSAAYGPTDLDMPALVRQYRSWGYKVLVVIGGRTTDIDVQPGDATTIMNAVGFDGVTYSSYNEPNLQGRSVQQVIDEAIMVYNEGHALNAGFKVWGPVWAGYDRNVLKQFAAALGSRLGGLDYHHYEMGGSVVSTSTAMDHTGSFEQEVRELRSDLAGLGLPDAQVNVDELNWAWQYQDGMPGGENRFFKAENTVWMTSVLGHVLRAGGKAMPYSTQAGALSIMIEGGNVNPDNRPASSPMPAYWGITNWTGGHLFPHYKDTLFNTTSSDGNAEVFAVNNEAGGYNIVEVNKSESDTKTLNLATRAVKGGTFTAYRNDPSKAYDAPTVANTGSYAAAGNLTTTLPPMTVTTLVFTPGAGGGTTAVPPTAPQALTAAFNTAQTTADLAWAAPAAGGSAPITGYTVSRNGTDSTGGGVYTTTLPATARSFQFSLLNPVGAYSFTVKAVSSAGTGPVATVSSSVTSTAVANLAGTRNAGRDTVALTWAPPTSVGGSPVTGYYVSRNGSDSTGGGAYSTTLSATARSFSFSLLSSTQTYTFTVQPVIAAGKGTPATVTK